MSRTPKVAILYGKGRALPEVIERIRAQLPGAEIAVIVPPDYTASSADGAPPPETIRTDLARYSLRGPGAFLRLIRQLRAPRFDTFIILFDTPRQRLIARCVGASASYYCNMDGRVVPIRPSVCRILADILARHVRGRLTYAALRLLVRLLPVRHVK